MPSHSTSSSLVVLSLGGRSVAVSLSGLRFSMEFSCSYCDIRGPGESTSQAIVCRAPQNGGFITSLPRKNPSSAIASSSGRKNGQNEEFGEIDQSNPRVDSIVRRLVALITFFHSADQPSSVRLLCSLTSSQPLSTMRFNAKRTDLANVLWLDQ